jgi:DNA polymerase
VGRKVGVAQGLSKKGGVVEALKMFKALGFELLPVGITPGTGAAIAVKEEEGMNNEEAIMTQGVVRPLTQVVASPLKAQALNDIRNEIGDCRRCKLCQGRNNIVFGEGNPAARLMFIGEGPGADEDAQGRPFVGKAGQVLTNLINKLGFERGDFYIANVVKCRPPENRNPEEDEITACRVFLEKQIDAISPSVIMTLGRVATHALLSSDETISRMRGRFYDFRGIKVMPTFHPSYLLRSPKQKVKTWDDAKAVMRVLGFETPE